MTMHEKYGLIFERRELAFHGIRYFVEFEQSTTFHIRWLAFIEQFDADNCRSLIWDLERQITNKSGSEEILWYDAEFILEYPGFKYNPFPNNTENIHSYPIHDIKIILEE